jgi:hypothetical protein
VKLPETAILMDCNKSFHRFQQQLIEVIQLNCWI